MHLPPHPLAARILPGSNVSAIIPGDENRPLTAVPVSGDDPDGLAMLWHYPATLIKIVDGDTRDAKADFDPLVLLHTIRVRATVDTHR